MDWGGCLPMRPIATSSLSVIGEELGADDQLVFPIFEEELFRPARDVVLSVRPQYSEKIIAGMKKVELRRRFPMSAPRGAMAYIYSTSPVRAMVGSAEIAAVQKMPISDIWEKLGKLAHIERDDFDEYFSGLKDLDQTRLRIEEFRQLCG